MNDPENKPFFVGYLGIPAKLRLFLAAAAVVLIAGFAALGLSIGATQDDPGTASFQFALGPQTLTGTLEAGPYPILHVSVGTEHIPAGRTVILSGNGKRGVAPRAEPLDGQLVEVTGIALKRGDLDMLQLRGGKKGLRKADQGVGQSQPVKNLGRWQLSGEICDGKCLAGAMRPGRGLSHKACANLCISGGLPPVFVSSAPVDGRNFFLMGTKDGKALGPELLDHVAHYVSVEGEIEQRGQLHIFKIDPASLKLIN